MIQINSSFTPWKLILTQLITEKIEERCEKHEEIEILSNEAKELLEHITKEMPQLKGAHFELGYIYFIESQKKTGTERNNAAQKALNEYNTALRWEKDYDDLYYY